LKGLGGGAENRFLAALGMTILWWDDRVFAVGQFWRRVSGKKRVRL